jgi:hypothetical protein
MDIHSMGWSFSDEGGRGIALRVASFSAQPLVMLVRDVRHSGMWRIKRRDGSLTDMLNLAGAKDLALDIGDRVLRQRAGGRRAEGSPMRFSGEEVLGQPPEGKLTSEAPGGLEGGAHA